MKHFGMTGLLTLLLIGCSNSDKGTSTRMETSARPGAQPSDYPLYREFTVVNIDREAGIITTSHFDAYCENGERVESTWNQTKHFQIEQGTLTMLDQDEACYAELLTGSSQDIVGTWRDLQEVPIPDAPPWCRRENERDIEIDIRNSSLQISESKIIATGTLVSFCASELIRGNEDIVLDCARISTEFAEQTLIIEIDSFNFSENTMSLTIRNSQNQSCQVHFLEDVPEDVCASGNFGHAQKANCLEELTR